MVNGSSVTGWSSLSTRAEHDWRALPLMSMVQAPHTSSRQPLSHTGGVVGVPSDVVAWAAMYCRQAMMFRFGRWGTANSSHRAGSLGPSWRRIRITTVRPARASGAVAVVSVVVGFMAE